LAGAKAAAPAMREAKTAVFMVKPLNSTQQKDNKNVEKN
jgi:hypothetical protein